MKKYDVIIQPWTESERGWGQRPDGYSLHKTSEDRTKFIVEFNSHLPVEVPDEYSFANGPAKIISVTEDIYKKICASEDGIWITNQEGRELLNDG